MSENFNQIWPDDFDFETDETCQKTFKPFIEKHLGDLKAYDAQRPKDIKYIFHEHAPRVADSIHDLCIYMGLGERVANNMYWAVLPHDIGKTALDLSIWDTVTKPTEELKAIKRTHTVLGAEIIEDELDGIEHPFKDLMLDIMVHHHEQMDGHGTLGIPGEELSTPVRMAAIVEAFDGGTIWRKHFQDRDISIPGVLKRMREEKNSDFYDMELFEPFAEMKMIEHNKIIEENRSSEWKPSQN